MDNIVIEEQINDILVLKLNRPHVLNALNLDLVLVLYSILDKVLLDNSIKGLIITGNGDESFCAGGDLRYVSTISPIEAEKYASQVHNLLNKIENYKKPILAAINGYALGGGCQLALACDLRFASCNAKIGQPEVKIGIPPGWGGTQRLSRIVGIAKAKELIFTGKILSADEALNIHLINFLISSEHQDRNNKSNTHNKISLSNKNLITFCIDFLKDITKNNSHAIESIKTLINKANDVDIDSGLLLERYACSNCFSHIDKEKINSIIS